MRVLVTGGAGYIGSVAVERLLEAGHDVVVLDNLWRGHRSAVSGSVELHQVDLRDPEATARSVQSARPEAIIHFAAATLVPESVKEPALYFGSNVAGSQHLLAAALELGIDRFVLSSTAAVYGVPTSLPITEAAPTHPINPYGRSKRMVEEMLADYAEFAGLRYAALRYFNVAGATVQRGEDHDPETHVIPVALQTLLGRRPSFGVFGTDYATPDGTAIRDYVHVVDLIDAHLLALDRLTEGSLGPINLGTREGFSVLEIVAAIERVTGRALPTTFNPRRAGDPDALIADSGRARDVLGWQPTRSNLDEMVGSAWEWMQRHPHGYGD
jgi:UDP-glucose 4-epimerase